MALSSKQILPHGLWSLGLIALSAHAQVASPNINMVSGTTWPTGDPFLQRQNEPSVAVSSRNPAHLLAGANDYRTVDLPGLMTINETGDAWLGVFKSFDSGDTWQSNLIPGYPQDKSAIGRASPLYGLQAGADPVVRAGPNGMFYYSGIALNRVAGVANKVFVARFMDDNNLEAGDPIRYIDTKIVGVSSGGDFYDKPSIGVDLPRSGVGSCSIPLPLMPPSGNQLGAAKFDDDPRLHFPAGRVFVAYTRFVGGGASKDSRIVISRSDDCSNSWTSGQTISVTGATSQGAVIAIDPSNGRVFVFWRQFGVASGGAAGQDAILVSMSTDGQTFSAPTTVATITPFEEGTAPTIFRTNAYPTAAVDANGRVYVAWSERSGPSGAGRIMISTAMPGMSGWSTPVQADPGVANPANPGHQLMPALSVVGSTVTLAYYDLRQDHQVEKFTLQQNTGGMFTELLETEADVNPYFTRLIDDAGLQRRHTMDVRVAQAAVGSVVQNAMQFAPSIRVSSYVFGALQNPGAPQAVSGDPDLVQQLEFNPPNLPMFMGGMLPFMGDYIDAGGPTFVPNPDGTWSFNAADSSVTHVVWTDNRDVVAPPFQNGYNEWVQYTPVNLDPAGTLSTFDPTQTRQACDARIAGSRNQNIYTSRITPGVSVQAPGNTKPLGAIPGTNTLIQRAYPVTVRNATALPRSFQLRIAQQPPGGTASFIQTSPVPVVLIPLNVPAFSSNSRTVFATSTNPKAAIQILVQETSAGSVLATSSVTLNGDASNPTLINPNIPNPNIPNPNIPNLSVSNAEIYNPNIPNVTIGTPDFSNPNIPNPNIPNPNIPNPNIPNPNIPNPNIPNYVLANPNIPNPNIPNPNIPNPNIPNPNIPNPNIPNPNIPNVTVASASLSDTTWTLMNNGNTTAAFSLKFLPKAPAPNGANLQLIVTKPYSVPALGISQGLVNCKLTERLVLEPVLSIPNLMANATTILNANNPSFDPDLQNADTPAITLPPGGVAYVTIRGFNPVANAPIDATALLTPAWISHGISTGASMNSVTLLRIVTTALPNAQVNAAYSNIVLASGGTGQYTFSATGLPAGLSINSSNGLVSGTPAAGGSFAVFVTVKDGSTPQGSFTQPLNLFVAGAGVAINTNPNLPNAFAGAAYSTSLAASGGTSNYQWSVVSGSLPTGLSLSAGGAISGTPIPAGTFTFTVQAKDSVGAFGTASMTLVVVPQNIAVVTPATLPNATPGTAYSQTIAATGGSGKYSWAVTSGSLPPGIALDSGGRLIGTSTSPGIYKFTITANDTSFAGSSGSKAFTLTVNPLIQTASLPIGFQGYPYPATLLQGAGLTPYPPNTPPIGYSPYTWSATGLPPGLVLSPNGVLTGIPQSTGTSMVKITMTDGNAFASVVLPLTIQGLSTDSEFPISMTIHGPQQIVAAAGQLLTFNVDWTLNQLEGCPDCINQITVGYLGQEPAACIFDPAANPETDPVSFTTITREGVIFDLYAPKTPGRYYVVFGRTLNFFCHQNPGYGGGGPAQAIAAIDVIFSSVTHKTITISSVDINKTGTNYSTVFTSIPARAVPVSFSYTQTGTSPQQIQLGASAQLPDGCATPGISGTASGSVTPLLPGRYYVGFDVATNPGGCPSGGWWNLFPDATRAIGVVDLIPNDAPR